MKVYIAGKITGDENYRGKFAKAQDELEKDGHIVLNPAVLPEGLTKGEYMRICFAMIDTADEVHFLPGWQDSEGAKVEYAYCLYVGKRVIDADLFRHAKTQTAGQMKDCKADASRCFAKRLREVREKAGMKQVEIGEKIGVCPNIISYFESGSRFPNTETLIKISKLFGVSADWLLGLDEEVE